MDTFIQVGAKGNLAVQVTSHTTKGTKLIRSVHVEQLSERTFKVSLDFNMDPVAWMSCNVSTGDGWDGVDFQSDVDQPDFSWMAVMFKWLGDEETDLEMSWSTCEIGDDTDRVHFPSLFVSEILVTQVQKRGSWGESLVMSL